MDSMNYFIKSAPLPAVLHDGLSILEVSDDFKKVAGCCDAHETDLYRCLSVFFKPGKTLSDLIEGIKEKKELHLELIAYVKGKKTLWQAHSFVFIAGENNGPCRQVTWFIDKSYKDIIKAYWDLQIQVNLVSAEMMRRDAKLNDANLELKNLNEKLGSQMIERKKAEKKVEEAMEIKSHFISMVSHELRTPMTAIREGISIVLDGLAGNITTEQKDFLDTAKRNVDRLSRLINDVLDYQKLEAGRTMFNMQEEDVGLMINEVVKVMLPIAKGKSLYLESRTAPDTQKTIIDKDKIMQVLINLLNNAVKFTDKGGIVITASRDENSILISIKDTGIGVEKEDIPKLFQGFSQLEVARTKKRGGTGLGLAISKRIIEEHKGEMWLESEPGKGSEFKIRLPIKTKFKIIIVDDNKDILDICKGFLVDKGYDVICSGKGLEAIEIIQKDKPDLVLLDMKLEDINGYEIIGRLRSNKDISIIPILVMSGYPEELSKLESKKGEAALASISKPFHLEDLLSKIRALLRQKS